MKLNKWIEDNWYYLKDKIDFEIDRYKDWHISVTTILKIIWDKWFDYVLTNHKEAVDKAAELWTQEHYKAEKFFEKDSEIKEMNPNFTKFLILKNIEVIDREKKETKEYKWFKFRWSIDCIWSCMIDNPFTAPSYYDINIDYKNTNKHSPKYVLQLEWYRWFNWYDWILAYWKWKLKCVECKWELQDVWIELVDYFISLLENKYE